MPLQATQDLEARFAIFLNPIKDLTKNWEVDIAKYLEEYLVELSEVPITFDGGETTMNFAEAAMLIQGSTAVYSKKVEFLWQMVLQMLDLLSSKRNLESARNEHPKSGEGGKHKSHEVNLDFTETNNLTVGKSINMKEEDQESSERFKFLPAMPLHLVDKEGEKSQMRIALYLKNMESFGNKEDFRINRSYLTPVGLLCLDLPQEILKRRLTIIREVPISLNDSIAGFLNPNDGNMPQVPQNEKFNEVGSPENIEPVEDDNIDFMDHNDDEPDPIANFSSDEIVPEVEKESNEKLEVTIGRNGLRRRGQKEKIENVAKQKVTLPLKPRDPHVETPAKRPIRSGRIRKPMPCLCHKETRQEKKKSKLEKEAEQKKGIESVENYIAKDLANFINNNVHKDKLEDAALNPQLSNGLTQHDDLIKRKKKGQEGMNKEPSSPTHTEEEVERREEEKNQDHADFDEIPDLDLDNVGCDDDDDIPLPQPHQDTNFFALNGLVGANSSKLNESMFDEPETNYEALVQKLVSDYITSAQEYIASSELTKRVNKWKQMIMPKLEEEEERKVFDIHDYGSYILECFPQKSSNTNTTTADNVSFDKIVTNRSPREVSRIFLSCLMLANTYNVDLAESRDGDLEMDCLELKLLSRVRHHKRLEEFGPTSPRVKKKRKSNSEKRKKLSNEEEEEDFVIGQEEIIANERLEEFGPTSPHEKKKRKSNSEKRKKEEDFVIGQEDLIANEKEVLYSQKSKFKRAKTNNNSIDR